MLLMEQKRMIESNRLESNRLELNTLRSDSLYAIAIEIVAAQSGPLSNNLNEAIHAQIMNWFSLANPAIGSAIHDAQISPISVSGLIGRRRMNNATSGVKAGDVFTLRVSLLQGTLLSTLLAGLEIYQTNDAALKLDGFPFKLKQILALPGSNHLVGTAQYSLLAQLSYAASSLTLRFVSPTSFKQQGHIQPFPLPQTVFSGLRKRWNAFAPEPLSLPPIEWQGIVTNYDLKTRSIYLKGQPQLGAEGSVTYRFAQIEQAKVAHQLAQFASFAGVGRKTAMGMGQTRLKI